MANWKIGKCILLCVITGLAASTQAETVGKFARGEQLYQTQCHVCHTDAMHWRDKGLVTDWNSLTSQINRWQESTGAHWNAQDVAAVATYMNSVIYHFPEPAKK